MRYRQFLIFISVLLVFLSCRTNSKTGEANISNLTIHKDSILANSGISNPQKTINPFGQKELTVFKLQADSIITSSAHKKKLTYILKVDTLFGAKAKNTFLGDYIDSDSLSKAIDMQFSLPSPNKLYSFDFLIYFYSSDSTAYYAFNRFAKIYDTFKMEQNPIDGYIFRINNKLYYLNTPNSLASRYSSRALITVLNKLIKSNYPFPTDTLENHLPRKRG